MFTRIMYPLRINYNINIYLVARIAVPSNYGPYYHGLETPRSLYGTVYSYHGYFRFGLGFMLPVFVKFYGSLVVHGYRSVKSRVLHGTV